MQVVSFYGFRPKTVRSPSQNRMFLVRKPYGFGTENVKPLYNSFLLRTLSFFLLFWIVQISLR